MGVRFRLREEVKNEAAGRVGVTFRVFFIL